MNSFANEMIMAARGVFAIALGRRDAEKYFDLTIVGLIGALIALILALAISAFLPALLGDPVDGLSSTTALIFTAGVYLFQIGSAWVVLSLLNRADGFVPYLVVDFWSTFFVTILALVPNALQLETSMVMMVLAIMVLVIKINIIRLIIKLPVMNIILFFVAHLIAGFVGLLVLGSVLGVDPMVINSQVQ